MAMTIQDAFAVWESDCKPEVIQAYGADDDPALSESWNDYTDALCKDGELTSLQYRHCPAYDDTMPDDEPAFILEAMGITIGVASVNSRPGGNAFGVAARHWRFTLVRKPHSMAGFFSQGCAHTDPPTLPDIFYCLLLDASTDVDDFDSWADDMGADMSTADDRRRARATFNACKAQTEQFKTLFSEDEIGDLDELFQDF